jgi:hypothetical protein
LSSDIDRKNLSEVESQDAKAAAAAVMRKLLRSLFAGVLALTAVSAPAEDTPIPLLPGDYPTRPGDPGYHADRATRIGAQRKLDATTPEQKAAEKKAARARSKQN